MRRIFYISLIALSACSPLEPMRVQQESTELDAWLVPAGDNPIISGHLQGADKWWQGFADEQLNHYVKQALAQNFDVQAAQHRLAQSQAQWDKLDAGYIPSLNGTADRNRSFSSNTTQNAWNLGLSASYEIDLWGQISAQAASGEYQYLSTQAAYQIQVNLTVTQVTKAWYGWLTEDRKYRLLQGQHDRINNGLKVIRLRFNRGQVNVADVWQQEQLLESLNGNLALTKARREIYQQTLALWLGSAELMRESSDTLKNAHLPSISSLGSGIQLNTLKARPDVQQAWFKLQSSNADLAVAISERYPRLTLTASYSAGDKNIADVLDNWAGNLVAGLFVPLVDGGRLKAEVRRNEESVNEAIANYKQVLLSAAQEIQQLLTNENAQKNNLISLEKQLMLARKTESVQMQRYRKGGVDFLTLLSAQEDVLGLEINVMDARWQKVQFRIDLYRALSKGLLEDEVAQHEI